MKNFHTMQSILFDDLTPSRIVHHETELANPWAFDSDGNRILPENAKRRGIYTCPKCHELLVVRKRGKGEHSRRDHFCHKADTACKGYTPHETESYIHETAKVGIYKILKSCLEEQKPFNVSWTCPTCGRPFNGNLLYGAKTVMIEKRFNDDLEGQNHKQPDISLMDENGKLIVAIEIIYTHDIEPETWAFYESNSIVVLRLIFHSIEELNNLQQKLHSPDSINACLNVSCQVCQTKSLKRTIRPLYDRDGKCRGLAVAVTHPFEDAICWGLPFTLQDKQNARAYIKNYWPTKPITLELTEQEGKQYARIITDRPVQQSTTFRPIYNRNHPTIDDIESRGYRGANKFGRGNYKYHSSSNSKRGTGSKRNGGKRRK